MLEAYGIINSFELQQCNSSIVPFFRFNISSWFWLRGPIIVTEFDAATVLDRRLLSKLVCLILCACMFSKWYTVFNFVYVCRKSMDVSWSRIDKSFENVWVKNSSRHFSNSKLGNQRKHKRFINFKVEQIVQTFYHKSYSIYTCRVLCFFHPLYTQNYQTYMVHENLHFPMV